MWILAMTLCACRSAPRADGDSWAQPQFDLVDHMPVTSIAWSPDGRYIVAASTQGNQIHVWDVPRRKFILGFERTSSAAGFHELSWGRSGDLAICDGNFGAVKLYKARDWSQPRVLGSDGDRACSTSAFSSDGRELAVLGGLLRIYSVRDGRLLKVIDLVKEVSHGMPFAFKAIGYLPGTHDLLIGGDDFDSPDPHSQLTGHVWVLGAGEALPHREFAAYKYEPPNAPAQLISLAISPDGRMVATGTMTGAGAGQLGNVTAAVHILRIADGSLLATPLDAQGVGYQQGIQFTRNGRYLLVALGGIKTTHDIDVLDGRTFQQLATVHAASTVYGLAVQPDGSHFAVCAGSRIHIWSLPPRH